MLYYMCVQICQLSMTSFHLRCTRLSDLQLPEDDQNVCPKHVRALYYIHTHTHTHTHTLKLTGSEIYVEVLILFPRPSCHQVIHWFQSVKKYTLSKNGGHVNPLQKLYIYLETVKITQFMVRVWYSQLPFFIL